MDICIGIDLGTTFSAVSYWNGDKCEIIPNKDGKNITPSWVSFTNKEILIGDAAKATAQYNPDNTLYDIKRIIGK
jgi:molecular chaperone DnaK (HSP70)